MVSCGEFGTESVCDRDGNSLIGFSSELLIFCVRLTHFFERIAVSLFSKERHERIAHGRSFVKSDVIESLNVVLHKRATEERATGAIRSWT